jgi:hypothetical protein
MEYIELIKGFFLSPVETFRKVKDTDYGDTLVYFLVLAIVCAILSVLVMLGTLPLTWFTGIYGLPGTGMLSGFRIVLIVVMMIIAGLVFLFIGAAWLHLWVYLFGGRNGYRETLKTLAFGGTPGLLLGWIPFVGMLAVIWSLVLTFLGVRELQGISSARALGAVILAVVIPLILLVLLAAIFFVAYTQTGPVLTAVS